MKRLTGLLLLLLLFSSCFAQDLTGTWEGTSDGEYLKMVIIKRGNLYIGYTHDIDQGYCIANFLGDFTDSSQVLKGSGQSFIERTISHVLCSYKLTYSESNGGKYLSGTTRAKSPAMNILAFGLKLNTILKQISTDVDTTDYMRRWLLNNSTLVTTTPVPKKDSIRTGTKLLPDTTKLVAVTIQTPPTEKSIPTFNKKAFDDSIRTVKTGREHEVIKRITTSADSIVITISDNEIVDGDTITIFHNNEILVSRLFVSARPTRIVVPMTAATPVHEFVLVANNLGTIPPNTASVIIEAGRERYQLKAASDMKKNAVIIFEKKR